MRVLLVLLGLLCDPPEFVLPTPADTPVPVVTTKNPPSSATLKPDEILVVATTVPHLVFTIPDGVVEIASVVQAPGQTLLVFGKLPGEPRAKLHTYTTGNVYVFTPLQPGKSCLVLAVPEGAKEKDAASQFTVTVSGGGPQPPPEPAPDPEPPEPDNAEFRVLMLLDQTAPLAAQIAVNSAAVRDWLDENCTKADSGPEWRVWDRSSAEESVDDAPPLWQKLYRDTAPALKDGPQVVMARGTRVTIEGVQHQDQLLKVLKKAKGAQ